jgi:Ca2+/H+ antiporter
MTPPNPFIELAKDPVVTLAWFGYALLMLTIFGLGLAFTLRKGATLLAYATDQNNRQRDWWGEALNGWLPPAWWIGWAAVVLLVWVVIALTLGALLWVLGG